MRKRCFLWLMVALMPLCLLACGENGKVTTLDTPTNLVIENQYITFDEVDNASYYMINYDGNTITVKPSGTGEIVFDASKIFDEARTYEIKVKAIGTGNYADSSYTNTKTYIRTQAFSAPEVKINGQILTWSDIDDAKHYTIKVEYPNATLGMYTYSSNSFDIKPLLQEVGYYKFQVKVGAEADDNDYSPEISYLYEKQLDAPSNLLLTYDATSKEVYMYFVSDVNSYSYLINVNGVDYVLAEAYLDTYLEKSSYDNLNKLKLFSFLESQNVMVDKLDNLAITAVGKPAPTDHYITSNVSAKAYLDIKQVLEPTTLTLTSSGNGGLLSWNKVDNATGYVVYKNLEKLITLDANTTSLLITSDELTANAYTVQVEGSDKRFDSIFSNTITNYELLAKPNLAFSNNKLSWGNISNVSKYLLEIYNQQAVYNIVLSDGELEYDLNDLDFGKYNVRLMYLDVDNKVSAIAELSINWQKTLDQVSNVVIGNEYSRYVINFDAVDEAMGYAVRLNGNLLSKLWTTNSIDLTEYILVTGKYSLEIKAVAPQNKNIKDSQWTSVGDIQHAVKLAKPAITVVNDGDKYILKINKVDNAEKYNILINYIPIFEDGAEYLADGYDISSYFTSAQVYSIMVQAIAPKTNSSFVDSDFNTTNVIKYIQLDTINSDRIVVDSKDGKYFLKFDTQTYAANYDIKIVNTTTESEQLFNINSVPYDITHYVSNKGRYLIYVKAKANADLNYLYSDSAESGVPYILEKGKETLAVVGNIAIGDKVANSNNIIMSWDTVTNADSYYINMYFKALNSTQNVLIKEINTVSNQLNIGDYISKEGEYKFKIKAVSNGDYESSAFVDQTYNHTLTLKSDFERYTVFMNGVDYSHYITSYSQLKNIVWHYYLFNQDVFSYKIGNDEFSYRFKLMLGVDIGIIEKGCMAENSNFIVPTKDDGSNYSDVERLQYVVIMALNQYSEGVCINANTFDLARVIESQTGNYFEYNFESKLKTDKTDVVTSYVDTGIEINNASKFDKLSNELPTSQQRQGNNVFKIDAKEKVDVTTTEQLFMVVQYGRSPNFVGDCVAKTVYNNCRSVLNSIINYGMSDYEKVVAIYDWLIANVEYNDNFTRLMRVQTSFDSSVAFNNETLMGNCKYNYLEGVFYDESDRSASANGFAKAFVLMCRMEGIDAIKVNGSKDKYYAHYWNKVYIDATPNDEEDNPAWFCVDIASSYMQMKVNYDDYFVPTHRYFLVTDTLLENAGMVKTSSVDLTTSARSVGEAEDSNNDNYYKNTMFQYEKAMVKTDPDTGYPKKEIFSGRGHLQFMPSQNADEYFKDIIRYMVVTCQNDPSNMSKIDVISNYVVEIDMSNVDFDLSNVIDNITNSYCSAVSDEFNCGFRIHAESYDSNCDNKDDKIVIVIRP